MALRFKSHFNFRESSLSTLEENLENLKISRLSDSSLLLALELFLFDLKVQAGQARVPAEQSLAEREKKRKEIRRLQRRVLRLLRKTAFRLFQFRNALRFTGSFNRSFLIPLLKIIEVGSDGKEDSNADFLKVSIVNPKILFNATEKRSRVCSCN